MAFFQWLFGSGGGGPVECPFEPLASEEVARRAAWLDERIGGVDPSIRYEAVHANAAANQTDPVALHALASVQGALGDYPAALDTWYQAVFHDKELGRLLLANRMKGTILDLFQDDPDKGAQHYTTCQMLDGNWPEVKIYQAELAFRAGNRKELKRLLDALVPVGLQGPLGEAEAALHAEDHEAAVEALQVANWIAWMRCIQAVSG